MKLYHFSEESNIQVFEPKKLASRAEEPAMVWAIDEFHAPHYFFPRDCPRVCIWPEEDTSESDISRFFGHSQTNRIVAIETDWLERLRNSQLYRYTFISDYFTLYDANAGYYTTTQTVKPVLIDKMEDLLASLTSEDIEIRITPSLIPLKESILTSTVNFSIIRMR